MDADTKRAAGGPKVSPQSGPQTPRSFPIIKHWSRVFGALALFTLVCIALLKTALAGDIDVASELPPVTVVRGDGTAVRMLPNQEAPIIITVDEGDALYLRCRDGRPLYFGPWVGVIDGEAEQVGWVHGGYVSEHSGSCPKTRVETPLRLRRLGLTTDSRVNVRFGPSTSTLLIAKAYPDQPLWTDGRYARIGGHRWYTVQLESGVSGWIREDLLDLGWRSLVRPASLPPLPRAQVRIEPELSTRDGISFSVGGSYRPVGESGEMQRMVAAQLEHGAAAVLLSNMRHPTEVNLQDDGAIEVQIELYSLAYASPATLLDTNSEEMARSLLIGDSEISRDVEEMYGPEAAVMMRAGFLLVGGPETEEFVNVAYVLSNDPDVQAQAAVLAASGRDLGQVLAAATSREAMQAQRDLRVAAMNLSADLGRGGQIQVDRLHKLAEAEIGDIRRRGVRFTDEARERFQRLANSWPIEGRRRLENAVVPERLGHDVRAKTASWVSELQSEASSVAGGTWQNSTRDRDRIRRAAESTASQWFEVAEVNSRSIANRAQRRGDDTWRRTERSLTTGRAGARQQLDRWGRDANRAGEDLQRSIRRSSENLERDLRRSGGDLRRKIRNIKLPRIRLPGGGGLDH